MLLSTVHDAVLQALLGVWLLTFLLVIHSYNRPYVKKIHNFAEALALSTLVMTLNLGLLFRTSTDSSGGCGPFCQTVAICLIIVNLLVIAFFGYSIWCALYDRLLEMFGIDNKDGSRKVSIRNLMRMIFSKSGRLKHISPSFTNYTPSYRDEALARAILQEDFDARKKQIKDLQDEERDVRINEKFEFDVIDDGDDVLREAPSIMLMAEDRVTLRMSQNDLAGMETAPPPPPRVATIQEFAKQTSRQSSRQATPTMAEPAISLPEASSTSKPKRAEVALPPICLMAPQEMHPEEELYCDDDLIEMDEIPHLPSSLQSEELACLPGSEHVDGQNWNLTSS